MKTIQPDKSIELIVKDIIVIKNDTEGETSLQFFADGYAGIVYSKTEGGMQAQPQNKSMPPLFIYGQTLKPVKLCIQGCYELVVLRLFPFVLKSFYNLDAGKLNNECYDMHQTENGARLLQKLTHADNTNACINILTAYMQNMFEAKKPKLDLTIREAIGIFLERGAVTTITEVVNCLPITPRTFERRFLKEVGVTPKQFCQIVRFQQSLEQLAAKEYARLTDIVFHNGFADQSHFIRVFKAYTGSTPKKFTLS